MIKSFAHKGLEELFKEGGSRRVPPDFVAKCGHLLAALNVAKAPEDMNTPGYRFHGLQGHPKRWSVRVNKNWRITFGWQEGATDVDLEDYH
jgi:proteic killer suppression protein